MKTFNFDAFGNPLNRPVNGKARTMAADAPELHSDGVYDPAQATYYQPVQPHGQSASLAKFMYADQTPVDWIDPA